MPVEPYIRCSDIQYSIAFYTKILDFTLKMPPDPDPASYDAKHCMLERDGSLVHLSSHSGDGVFGSNIYIRIYNLDEVYARLDANKPELVDENNVKSIERGPITQSWGMREIGLRDPDGNGITYGQTYREEEF